MTDHRRSGIMGKPEAEFKYEKDLEMIDLHCWLMPDRRDSTGILEEAIVDYGIIQMQIRKQDRFESMVSEGVKKMTAGQINDTVRAEAA